MLLRSNDNILLPFPETNARGLAKQQNSQHCLLTHMDGRCGVRWSPVRGDTCWILGRYGLLYRHEPQGTLGCWCTHCDPSIRYINLPPHFLQIGEPVPVRDRERYRCTDNICNTVVRQGPSEPCAGGDARRTTILPVRLYFFVFSFSVV